MAIRNIRIEGDPILRKKSRPVKEINDRIKELGQDLLDTMEDAEGAGLAAVQVGVLRRVMAVMIDENESIVMVNPEILDEEGEQIGPEGCLSIPGFAGTVNRPKKLNVRYQNLDGEEITRVVEGFYARAVCHEVDHLNGILFRDLVIDELTQEEFYEERENEQN